VQFGVPALAHGGAAGLAAELGLVLVLLALGVRVWWQSRRLEERSGAPGTDDDAGVEKDDGDRERDGGLGDAEAEERAPARRR
jgi:predicted lipid-binding transport protein (Tim44 family)